MNVTITTFTNPFSFFCTPDTSTITELHGILHNEDVYYQHICSRDEMTDLKHGQYVAVMWRNKWVRGVVSMETHILIWLIDYGIFLSPNDINVNTELPSEYKKLPSKIFEASILGVVPTDKVWEWMADHFKFNNNITTTWTTGAIEKAHTIIKRANKTYFIPKAILTTQHNHVVLGDLYLEIEGKGVINLVDELKRWPVFIQQNLDTYIENLSKYYTSRRRHRLCSLKPKIQDFDLPNINLNITTKEFSSIMSKSPPIENFIDTPTVLKTDTIVGREKKDNFALKVKPSDLETYSNKFIIINDREYNVLSILVNKTRDLNMSEKYGDYDLKYIGRGISYKRRDFCH